MTGLDIALLLILGVTAFCAYTGGLRSVVETDIGQIAVMLGATAVFVALCPLWIRLGFPRGGGE